MVARFFFILLLLIIVLPAHAMVKAIADRTVLSINESLSLEIIQTETKGGKPDLSILEKDFAIVSKSQSQQYNLINGKSSRKYVWSVVLMPKKAGEVIIPAISLGKEKTSPIHLVIHKSSQGQTPTAKNQANQDVFIDVQIEPKDDVYVQQKIDLSIRIYYRVRLSNLSLAQLVINDVIMEQVGEDKQYNKIINKHTYMVIERHYALFPQKSGYLTIPAIRFEAMQTLSSSGNFGGFFSSQRGKPIHKQSNKINITIKKKPDNYTGKYWLPAENIQVISQHSDLSDIKVGDSITITDKIIAKGILGTLLPSISWPTLDKMKTYPDKASINTQSDKGSLYGLREEKMAIIPVYSGQYQLPDRKIIWWNTLTNQQEEKIIPGIRFYVAEAQGSISLSDQKAEQQANQPQPHQILPILENVDQEPGQQSPSIIKNYTGYASTRKNPWFWAWLVTSLVLSVLLIISLFFAFREHPLSDSEKSTNTNKNKSAFNQKDWLKQIKQSCSANDKSQTMKLLSQWANTSKIKDEILEKNMLILEQALYSSQSVDWEGDDLFNSLKNYLNKNNQHSAKKSELLPLNPL
ncbi:MAG: BatD family protein [Pseudomonadota bacterium]